MTDSLRKFVEVTWKVRAAMSVHPQSLQDFIWRAHKRPALRFIALRCQTTSLLCGPATFGIRRRRRRHFRVAAVSMHQFSVSVGVNTPDRSSCRFYRVYKLRTNAPHGTKMRCLQIERQANLPVSSAAVPSLCTCIRFWVLFTKLV